METVATPIIPLIVVSYMAPKEPCQQQTTRRAFRIFVVVNIAPAFFVAPVTSYVARPSRGSGSPEQRGTRSSAPFPIFVPSFVRYRCDGSNVSGFTISSTPGGIAATET